MPAALESAARLTRLPPSARAFGRARAGCSAIWRRRRLRLGLLTVVIAVPALVGGWMWLRDSSLVSVERVQISGVHGPEARSIEAALGRAARHMSTLDVHPGALTAAVAPYRVVRAVHASPSFPHGLRIRVFEQLPVAALTVAAGRTAVAADGVVLGPALLSNSLPALGAGLNGSGIGRATGERVHGSSLLAALTVLGAAPARLAAAVERVFMGPQGVTVAMRNGLLVYFGDATRPHAKWLSLARVLADPSSQGASYVDVRLPERPAAGFASGAGPATSTATGEPSSASDPTTAAALAAGLTSALGLQSPAEQTKAAEGSLEQLRARRRHVPAPPRRPAPPRAKRSAAPAAEASPTAPTPGG